MGILDDVTTNPSLMAKENVKGKEQIMAHYKTICDIVDGPVSAEIFGHTCKFPWEKKIIYPNICIKRNKKKGKSDTP